MENSTGQKREGPGLTILGMILGSALGVAVWLVYTRQSGSENRERFGHWAHVRLEDLQHKAGGSE
jgi:hypothetical protein